MKTKKSEKSGRERLGFGLMAAGFVVLLVAGTGLFLYSRGSFPLGVVGRQLLLVGLGVYVLGRMVYWQARRVRVKAEES